MVYYNEIDRFTAAWLRRLIDRGCLPNGYVDCRDIREVRPEDLANHQHCHFFAGIGGWPLALSMARWPESIPAWTGSCPCQPFSSLGEKRGINDERHLWPHWFRLIKECRPAVILGEQVESKLAKAWLDSVFNDLEGIDYSCGAAILPAASVGAPHLRHRIWFVALRENTAYSQCERLANNRSLGLQQTLQVQRSSAAGCVAHACGQSGQQVAGGSSQDEDAHEGKGWQQCQPDGHNRFAGDGQDRLLADPWSDAIWLSCRDGKLRPTQPGLFPLADGVPARMGRLRAYGNAIVPQVAAEFIKVIIDYLGMPK